MGLVVAAVAVAVAAAVVAVAVAGVVLGTVAAVRRSRETWHFEAIGVGLDSLPGHPSTHCQTAADHVGFLREFEVSG